MRASAAGLQDIIRRAKCVRPASWQVAEHESARTQLLQEAEFLDLGFVVGRG